MATADLRALREHLKRGGPAPIIFHHIEAMVPRAVARVEHYETEGVGSIA